LVRERIHLDGIAAARLDTAGLREGGDLVEEEGYAARQGGECSGRDRVLSSSTR